MKKSLKNLSEDCVFTKTNSPIGELVIVGNAEGLQLILWNAQQDDPDCIARLAQMSMATRNSPVNRACSQLSEYFAGERTEFEVPLVLKGTTFQKLAWQQLLQIPYGSTRTYQQQGERVGGKQKARAVGMANGKNPIPIIVPCHRVIGKDGSLTGFGGGLETKRYLLELESRHSMCAQPVQMTFDNIH